MPTYFVGRAVSTKSNAHEIIISSDIFGTKEVIWTIFEQRHHILGHLRSGKQNQNKSDGSNACT